MEADKHGEGVKIQSLQTEEKTEGDNFSLGDEFTSNLHDLNSTLAGESLICSMQVKLTRDLSF